MAEKEDLRVPATVAKKLWDELKVNSFASCRDEQRAYGECTQGRTFSTVWACRSALTDLNNCLGRYTTEEEYRRLKREWIAETGFVHPVPFSKVLEEEARRTAAKH